MRPIPRLNFPIEDYLQRIGLRETPATDEEGLRALQSAQVFSLPFENLDCLMKLSIPLDLDSLVNKLVHQARGGYCFELNGLLQFALEHLGFSVRPLLGRGLYRVEAVDPRTHYFLLVKLNDREWIVDAGFGGPGLLAPLPLELGRVEKQYTQQFKLIPTEDHKIILQRFNEPAWEDLYIFDREKVFPVDIEVANFFASSSPTSIFRRHLLCSISSPTKKYSIFDKKYFENGQQSGADHFIASSQQLAQTLSGPFGIKYSINHLDMIYQNLSGA